MGKIKIIKNIDIPHPFTFSLDCLAAMEMSFHGIKLGLGGVEVALARALHR